MPPAMPPSPASAAEQAACTLLVMPDKARPRKRGSKFHEDLRTTMDAFGMNEFTGSIVTSSSLGVRAEA